MGRQIVGVLLTLFCLSFVFNGLAQATSTMGDFEFQVDFQFNSNYDWIDEANPLTIATSVVNHGSDSTLVNNPSCDVVIQVRDVTGVLVFDGLQECRQQERGIDIPAGTTHEFEAMIWTMLDDDGQPLPSGQYQVTALHGATGMSAHSTFHLQTSVELPDQLEYTLISAGGSDVDMDEIFVQIFVHNIGHTTVDTSIYDQCYLHYMFTDTGAFGPSCFGGKSTLIAGETLYLGYIQLHPALDSVFTLQTPGGQYVKTINLTQPTVLPSSEFDVELKIQSNLDDYVFAPGNALISDLYLTSSIDQTIVFTDTCKTQVLVFDDHGTNVYNSNDDIECKTTNIEVIVEANIPEVFNLPRWSFFDKDGCSVAPGHYLVVASIPEFHVVSSQEIEFIDVAYQPCQPPATMSFSVDVVEQGQGYDVAYTLSSSEHGAEIRMTNPCLIQMRVFGSSGNEVVNKQLGCNDYFGRRLNLLAQENYTLDRFSLELMQLDGTPFPDDTYVIESTLLSAPKMTVSTVIQLNSSTEVFNEGPFEQQPYTVAGTWFGIQTAGGTCWAIESSGQTYLLASGGSGWMPSSSKQGMYEVVDSILSPECSQFDAPSVHIQTVLHEQAIPSQAAEDDTVSIDTPEPSPTQYVVDEEVISVVTVVATTSLLSLCIIFITSTESLRIPTTAAGLWFLGLIGKTHETTDGRYQRGRLMGYLTANPGCHFRALMAALEMSNGQITHHLRILEAEENVWRINDGRLVRYYPLTKQLHPNMNEEDLPVPPLSPDPTSLQGKILNLLDHDGQLGTFPTQAELAKRLEKSQQLISHHLRTLQKFGLVERRKMGVKHRYKLTREAIFLLETNEDFSQ